MIKNKFEFTITGFVIALVLISMFAFVFGKFATDLENDFNIPGNNTLSDYNQYDALNSSTYKIKESTEISQDEGLLDVIGGFFSSGYAALRISFNSFSLFDTMIDQAADDVEGFGFIKDYVVLFIIVGIFLGVGIAVLVRIKGI